MTIRELLIEIVSFLGAMALLGAVYAMAPWVVTWAVKINDAMFASLLAQLPWTAGHGQFLSAFPPGRVALVVEVGIALEMIVKSLFEKAKKS